MNPDELNAYRIDRLASAIQKISDGDRTDFGRKLGYADGAFVRQMLAGKRPLTEKTIMRIEAMHGMAGWFAKGRAQQEERPIALLSDDELYERMVAHLEDVQKLAKTLIEKRSSPTKGGQNSPATGEQVSNFTTPKSFQANGRHTSIPHKKTGSGRHK